MKFVIMMMVPNNGNPSEIYMLALSYKDSNTFKWYK